MEEILFVSEERKVELDKTFEKEISELMTKKINKHEFFIIIKAKRISFSDFYYLVHTYIAPIKVIEEQDNLLNRIKLLNIDDSYFETEPETDISFNRTSNNTIPKIQNITKIKKHEKMKSKSKKILKKRNTRVRIS